MHILQNSHFRLSLWLVVMALCYANGIILKTSWGWAVPSSGSSLVMTKPYINLVVNKRWLESIASDPAWLRFDHHTKFQLIWLRKGWFITVKEFNPIDFVNPNYNLGKPKWSTFLCKKSTFIILAHLVKIWLSYNCNGI